MPETWFLATAAVAFLAAGAIKGLSGLGLPTAAIGVMTQFVDPRTAIALLLIPMIVSNAWQVYRMGEVWRALRDYSVFASVLVVGVLVTSILTADVSDRVLFGVIGGVIVLFVAVNIGYRPPRLPDRYNRVAQASLGAASGVLGGLTGVWAAPMVIYLYAKQVSKDEFVRATGLLIFLGSLPLTVGYLQQGALTWTLAGVSVGLIAPTLLGFALGEALRSRLSAERFRKVFLFVFLLLGLNLCRRAFF